MTAQLIQTVNGLQYPARRQWQMTPDQQRAFGLLASADSNTSITGRRVSVGQRKAAA